MPVITLAPKQTVKLIPQYPTHTHLILGRHTPLQCLELLHLPAVPGDVLMSHSWRWPHGDVSVSHTFMFQHFIPSYSSTFMFQYPIPSCSSIPYLHVPTSHTFMFQYPILSCSSVPYLHVPMSLQVNRKEEG